MSIATHRPKGPPLNALRAFETAARCGSFTAAADELCVTPGAIAQHVKTLEHWAGAALFIRKAHGIELTALGSDILPGFITAFDSLGDAVKSLRTRARPDEIRIAALPSLAQLWLSPRLPRIRAAYPDLGISVFASEYPPNLDREQFDLSIFFQDAPLASGQLRIEHDVIFPVCSPALSQRIQHPEDLGAVTCLHDVSWNNDWQLWLQEQEPVIDVHTSGPGFSLYSLMLEEARNGAGVMIGHQALVRDHLERGELVRPFAGSVTLERGLVLSVQVNAPNADILKKIANALLETNAGQAHFTGVR